MEVQVGKEHKWLVAENFSGNKDDAGIVLSNERKPFQNLCYLKRVENT